MRISDWISDVCSSDLHRLHRDATVRLRSQLVDVRAHPVRLQLVFLAPGLLVAVQQPVHRAAVGIPGMAPCDVQRYARPGHADVTPAQTYGALLAVFLRSEEHMSELQSLMRIKYAVSSL